MCIYEKSGSLAAAFKKANNCIAWGIYDIQKQPDEPWQNARFSMLGKEINLQPRAAMLMALLIAHEGTPVTLATIMNEFTKPGNGGNKAAANMDEEKVYNNLKVQTFKMRRTLANAFCDENAGRLIENLNPSRSSGEAGQYIEGNKGALKLMQE